MRIKSTIIGLVILLLLGGYVYYYERTPVEEDESGNKKVLLIPKFELGKVTMFSITGKDSTQTILCTRNSDSTWSMQKPIVTRAEKLDVETYLADLKELKADQVLKDNLLPLASYGLETPTLVLTVKLSNTVGEIKLSLGNTNPDGNLVYLKKNNEPAVYLVPSTVTERWNRNSGDFREKVITVFAPEKVNGLTLTTPKQKWIFQKANDEWKLIQPVSVVLDKYKVEDLIWKLHSSQIRQFIDESPKDLKSYGLDKPVLSVDIKTEDGKQNTLILSGTGPQPNLVYGKTGDKSFVFALDRSVESTFLISDIQSMRNKDVFQFIVEDINSVQANQLNLVKENNTWYSMTPQRTLLDNTKVQNLLWKLNGLRIKNFVEETPRDLNKYGLQNPSTKIVLVDKNKKTYSLLLGKPAKTGLEIYAKTEASPLVFSLDTDIPGINHLSVDELISRDTSKKK